MQPSRAVRITVPVVAAVVVAGGGAWALGRPAGDTSGGGAGAVRTGLADYTTVTSCDQLLDRLRAWAMPRVTPYGLDGGTAFAVPSVSPGIRAEAAPVPLAAAAGADAGAPAAAPGAPAGLTSTTGTNVQVAGVDEADVTKRSGDLVLTVASSGASTGLVVLRTLPDGSASVIGRLRTGWRPTSLLVQGGTVLLLGATPALQERGVQDPPPVPPRHPYKAIPPLPAQVRVAQVDVANPAHPRLVRTLDVDGSLVGARLHDGVAQLSVSATPDRLPFVRPALPRPVPLPAEAMAAPAYAAPDAAGGVPTWSPGAGTGRDVEAVTREALETNRRVVRTSTIDQWLPQWMLTPATGRATHGRLLDCSRVGLPGAFSGLGTLAMLTVDLRSGGVDRWDGAGVVATGATLYSAGDRSYVATTQWPDPATPTPSATSGAASGPVSGSPAISTPRTLVHAFATGADGVRYLGSGSVDGTLIGSSALDEYEGRLRVATTTSPAFAVGAAEGPAVGVPPGPTAPAPAPAVPVPARPAMPVSSSAVTVLELRDGTLVQMGKVDGLGTTETIHAVRFAGPVGYVVTFRQTDPLYTLDLADPAHPRVAGELKLPGFSAYLHPLDGGLLLGVGQDAASDGVVTGLRMSLFDVADPAHPRLLDAVSLPGTRAATDEDPHAFTYAGGLALVPAQGDVYVEGGPATAPAPAQEPGEGAVVAVRVEGRSLGAPQVLHLRGDRDEPGVDISQLRTFADATIVWGVAPAGDESVATAWDAASLAWLHTSGF